MRWCTKTDKYQVCTSGANKDNDNDKIAWVMSRRVCGVMTRQRQRQTNKVKQTETIPMTKKLTMWLKSFGWWAAMFAATVPPRPSPTFGFKNYKLQTANYKLQIKNSKFQIAYSECLIPVKWLQKRNDKLQSMNHYHGSSNSFSKTLPHFDSLDWGFFVSIPSTTFPTVTLYKICLTFR